MNVNEDIILRLESLSMLSLSEQERQELLPNLEKMISMVDKLSEINTSDDKVVLKINNHHQVLKSDNIQNMLVNNEAVKNTKFNSDVYFTVPKVLK